MLRVISLPVNILDVVTAVQWDCTYAGPTGNCTKDSPKTYHDIFKVCSGALKLTHNDL